MKYLVAFVFSICFFITGCGAIPYTKEEGRPIYSLTDAFGTKVDFYAKPCRIVSLNNSIDEILLDLVPSERIAAITYLADDPTLCCAGDKVKLVKNRVYGGNFEGLVALNPDLVFTASFNGSGYADSLRAAGLKVVTCQTPNNIKGILQYIREVAAAVGEKERGEILVGTLQKDMESIRAKVVAAKEDKLVRVLALSTMGVMGPAGTFNDLCYYAGIRNALEGYNVPAQAVLSEELLLEINPDVIFMPSWDYTKKNDLDNFAKEILENPLYKNVNAVKNKRVYKLHDQYLYSTNQYTIKAVEEMAKLCYPELF
ncbi:MAG: ABC transporter substrate-binding protein [Acidaminococcaceae bacterium]|nr:ABC transporter substrate-binding protein [Acidaminococcaceae bacterium]